MSNKYMNIFDTYKKTPDFKRISRTFFTWGLKTNSLRWIREKRNQVIYEDISTLELSKN